MNNEKKNEKKKEFTEKGLNRNKSGKRE